MREEKEETTDKFKRQGEDYIDLQCELNKTRIEYEELEASLQERDKQMNEYKHKYEQSLSGKSQQDKAVQDRIKDLEAQLDTYQNIQSNYAESKRYFYLFTFFCFF